MPLMWDKPARKMPVETWKNISADDAPPGVYIPNMSDEDADKFRGKLCGTKSGKPRVEIRTSRGGSQLLCQVSLVGISDNEWEERRGEKWNVRISSNGPVKLSFDDWNELNQCIAEAKAKLENV
jgi:hypothetical protein